MFMKVKIHGKKELKKFLGLKDKAGWELINQQMIDDYANKTIIVCDDDTNVGSNRYLEFSKNPHGIYDYGPNNWDSILFTVIDKNYEFSQKECDEQTLLIHSY
jgi:hypothetical protein